MFGADMYEKWFGEEMFEERLKSTPGGIRTEMRNS